MTAAVPVYVASPLGFTVPTRLFYTRTLLPALVGTGARILDPWDPPFQDLPAALSLPPGPARDFALKAANRRLGERNRLLLDEAAAVFAVLDGVDVDSGTAAEIGYAAACGKPVIAWRSDLRSAGDNTACLVNLQVEHFVEMYGSMHTDFGAAVNALAVVLFGGTEDAGQR
jgi:nucleoside 2-deoxyribosyltransferase